MSLERDIVLFLCVANSARSQMAEGLARRAAPPGVTICSAGSEPASVNPHAVRAMAEIGIDLSGHASKAATSIPERRVRLVVTLCAEEVCPAPLGEAPHLAWPHDDPAAEPGDDAQVQEAFRRVRDEIGAKIDALFESPAFAADLGQG